jgi:hypothetical protein
MTQALKGRYNIAFCSALLGLWYHRYFFPRAALVAKRHFALPWAILLGPFGANLFKHCNFKTYASGYQLFKLTMRSRSRPGALVSPAESQQGKGQEQPQQHGDRQRGVEGEELPQHDETYDHRQEREAVLKPPGHQ